MAGPMSRARAFFLTMASGVFLFGGPERASASSPIGAGEITTHTLPNGLTVILESDHRLPVVAVHVWYRVGAMHEAPHQSGLAHLVEHLMFQETRRLGPGEIFTRLEAAGAYDINATTHIDHTEYFETVPSSNLELALWAEAERMAFMGEGVSESRLEIEKRVVQNERRESFENRPYGRSQLTLHEHLYGAEWSVHHGVIGAPSHIQAVKKDAVVAFHNRHYRPANASIALVGDFRTDEALGLIDRYFGRITGGPSVISAAAPRPSFPQRAFQVIDPLVDRARVSMLWPGPAPYSAEYFDLQVLAEVFSRSRGGRLAALNVHGEYLEGVAAGLISIPGGSLFRLDLQAASGANVTMARRRLEQVLEDFKLRPPTAREVDGAIQSLETGVLRSLETVGGHGRARLLQVLHHEAGGADRLPWLLANVRRVTPMRTRKSAERFLPRGAGLIIETFPETRR